MTDLLGRPAILRLTVGNVADVNMAEPLLGAGGRVGRLIADKGYDANALRKRLNAEGAEATIPGRWHRKVPIDYDEVPLQRPLAHRGSLLQAEELPPCRHLPSPNRKKPAIAPQRRATAEMLAPGSTLTATIRAFSDGVQQRR